MILHDLWHVHATGSSPRKSDGDGVLRYVEARSQQLIEAVETLNPKEEPYGNPE